jgi:hypothetical protein
MFVALAAAALAGAPQPAEQLPLWYELMINGESFLVEANRAVKLESREKPGVSYEIALRVAPSQRLKLANVQFEYDRLSKVEQSGGKQQPSARLTHELGFTMLITDLGQSLEPKAQDETLRLLTESVTATYKKMNVAKLQVAQPHDRKFDGASGRGAVVYYRDAQDVGHTCLIYVLGGAKFAVSCLAEYLDNDAEDALPLIKKTLDSCRPSR